MDAGLEPLTDLVEFTQLIRQARSIIGRSILYALLITLATLALPVAG